MTDPSIPPDDLPTLTRAELAAHLAQQLDQVPADTLPLVHSFFDVLTQQLQQGRSVSLCGFGRFQLRDKNARPGRNPRTGEPVPVTARRVVTFQASPKLRAQIQAGMAGRAAQDSTCSSPDAPPAEVPSTPSAPSAPSTPSGHAPPST